MKHREPNTRRRPTRHSTVVSYLALFLALAGTAWAASTIGSGDVVNNSLKSADLKNNGGVKTADVANRSLGGGDVRNDSLRGRDFGANSIGGADVNEAALGVSRIVHALGGPVNQQVTSSLQIKLIPDSSFTQGPTETDQTFGTVQVTFPASCTQPRQFVAYLQLDDPTVPQGTVGVVQMLDTGAGAVTKRAVIGTSPFGLATANLIRTGAAVPHQFFMQAAGLCNSGAGITLDSVLIDVVGHR